MKLNKYFRIGLIVICYVLIISGIYWWIHNNGPYKIRNHLMSYTFWFLEFNFLLIIIGIILNFDIIKKLWYKISLKSRILLALIILTGMILTCFIAPRTHRLYYDEDIYLNIGQNLACLKKAQMCNEGYNSYGVYQCYRGEYNKQPYGYPYLLSVVYRLFGISKEAAFLFNNLMFGLSIIVVFLLGLLLFESQVSALWCAFLYALVPENNLWFSTAAAEPSSAFFTAFSILCIFLFIKYQKTTLLFLAIVVISFSQNFRPESILLLPIIFIIILLFSRKLFSEYRFYLLGMLALCLVIPIIGHQYAVKMENWGASGAKFASNYFQHNLSVNGLFYWKNIRFPAIFSLFAAIGLIWKARWKEKSIALLWFVLFWGIFLFFYAGSYNYGVDVRYSLLSYVPLILLAGFGLYKLQTLLKNRTEKAFVAPVMTVVILLSFISFMPLIRAETEESWPCREDYKYAKEFAELLPDDSIVLTHNPNMFLIWGKNAIQTSIASTEFNYVNNSLFNRHTGGVYFHWNYWCTVPNNLQNSFCNNVLNQFDYEIVRDYQVRDYRFALYRLYRKQEKNERKE